MRGAYAAGKLNVGFWDHWVPGANDTMAKLCHEWADKEKVEIKIDFITSQGDKLMLTGRRRGAGAVRARHSGDADLVRRAEGREISCRSTI